MSQLSDETKPTLKKAQAQIYGSNLNIQLGMMAKIMESIHRQYNN